MSLNRFNIFLPLENDILAFFDLGNMSAVHWRICLLVSKSYWNTRVSSTVTAFFQNGNSFEKNRVDLDYVHFVVVRQNFGRRHDPHISFVHVYHQN